MVDGGTQERGDWYGDAPLKLQRMIQDDASPKCGGGNASPDEVGEPHSQGNRDSRKCTEPSTPVAEVADAGAPAAVMGDLPAWKVLSSQQCFLLSPPSVDVLLSTKCRWMRIREIHVILPSACTHL